MYTTPARMTTPGRHAPLLAGLPTDIGALARVGHGLMIHEHLTWAYGVEQTPEERRTVHLRQVDRLLDAITAADSRPLVVPREPGVRTAGNCRHFTVLLVTMLRAQGVPARARCGFGGYFGVDNYEDHWVCEYWNAAEGRWILVDAQIDAVQQKMFPIDFDVTDVPRDRFLIAGDAWALCRAGKADPGRFGLSFTNEFGYWWIAGNLMRDAAALTNIELLPWDTWGQMPAPEEEIAEDLAVLFDRMAVLTQDPDRHLAELRHLMRTDERLRVPALVRNDLRQCDEAI